MEPNQTQEESQKKVTKENNKAKILIIIFAIIVIVLAILFSRTKTEAPTEEPPQTRDIGQEVTPVQ
jgi:uncharacterized membrane protein affecting hemolysin expression